MIRVLHVIGKMDRAGAETMIMNIYRVIDRTKVQFDFAVLTDDEGDYDQEILSLGGMIYHFPPFIVKNIIGCKSMWKKFFEEHPEYQIIHGHIGSCAAFYLQAAKECGRFTIAHSHAAHFKLSLWSLSFRIISFPTRYVADYFFACSEKAGRDRYGKKVVEGKNYSILTNGIPISEYTYDEKRHMLMKKNLGCEGKIVFGHVGRLAVEKNHDFLFKVYAKVKEIVPNSCLVLAGRGPRENELIQMTKTLGIEENVKFLGVRKDIPDLMNAFDVFLFPSHNEGLGISLVEAQAAGLPCIMADTIPREAIITPNVYVEPIDKGEDCWVDRIKSILHNFDRKNITEMIRESDYNIEKSAEKLMLQYLEWSIPVIQK